MSDITPEKRKQLDDLRHQLSRLGHGKGKASDLRTFRAEDLRRSIRKQKASDAGTAAGTRTILYQRDLPRSSRSDTKPANRAAKYRVVLEDSVSGGKEVHTAHGRLFEITRMVNDIEGTQRLNETFERQLNEFQSPLCRRLTATLDPFDLSPADIVFMDIESTGLTNSPLFLIGIMIWGKSGFEVKQFFARNYAEETSVIARFVESCLSKRLLVTFNGKSYDVPFIRARAAATGLSYDLELSHVDLLHMSRRIWKDELPNCKLQTLERHVCGRERYGDIPGSEIPEAYHAFVRTNDAWQMLEALKHNMLDLITLADIMTRFPDTDDIQNR